MLYFSAETPITVKQNNHEALKNIELIVGGYEVGGYDHTLKKFAWGVVKGTNKSIKKGLVAMYAAGMLIARPTLEHPVWTENHHDYVAAQNLKVGDTFLDGNGATLRLDSLVVKPDTTLTVYNFEVENLHNYYVGTQEVLVHNTCATLENLAGKLSPPLSAVAATTLIKDLENSLRKANISSTERTKFYEQVFNDLNTNKLTSSDVNRLLTEFSSSSLDPKIKKFLANFTDKGSLDVWISTKSWSNRLDILEQMANIKINTKNIKPVYNFSKTATGFEVWQGLQPGGTKWATVTQDKVTALAGGTPGEYLNDFNQALNVYPALKNMEYEVDGRFIYKTDANGYVSEMTDKNIQYPTPVRERNLAEQTDNSKKKGNNPNDAGGYIASNESNGPSEQINYWRMNSASNSGGAWENMENYVKINLKGADPTATFEVVYTGKNFINGRPSNIEIKVFRNGSSFTIPVQHRNIPNYNIVTFPILENETSGERNN